MKRFKNSIVLVSLFLSLFSLPVSAQKSKFAPVAGRKPTRAAIEALEQDVPKLMKAAAVPGLSAALCCFRCRCS